MSHFDEFDLKNEFNLIQFKKDASSSSGILSLEDIERELEEEGSTQLKPIPIKFNKQILKNRKNPKKGYVKRQFCMVPIILKELTTINKYLLFGFQEVETYYRDYTNPYDVSLIDCSRSIVGIRSLENNHKTNELHLNMYSKGNSGMSDFQFLIDHFQKFTTQDYRNLTLQLIAYQKLVTTLMEHYDELRMKLTSRIITPEEIFQAKNDFEQYVQKKIEHISESHFFYVYEIFTVNPETMDVSPVRKSISIALMSLLGVEPSDYEQLILHQGNLFQCSFGSQRMQCLLDTIQMFVNGQNIQVIDSYISTADGIKIPSKVELEVVYWEKRPEWAGKFDFVMLVEKIDITAEKIKSVIEQRSQKSRVEIDTEIIESMQFDYVIQSEIFLEKFYPDLFEGMKTRKSIRSTPITQTQSQSHFIQLE